ncbi:MAG TPA: hypothetical protein VFP10_07105 [Candidatus Eisenbacteria bacterium]|nr:hypothetical protein [Candidatus Eisenbacteria bacterium]
MDSSELERAILIYLGADPNGGVYPVGMEERVRSEYGPLTELILKEIRKILSILDEYEPDRSVDTLQFAAQKVEDDLVRRLPNYSTSLHKAMANYWSYGWR